MTERACNKKINSTKIVIVCTKLTWGVGKPGAQQARVGGQSRQQLRRARLEGVQCADGSSGQEWRQRCGEAVSQPRQPLVVYNLAVPRAESPHRRQRVACSGTGPPRFCNQRLQGAVQRFKESFMLFPSATVPVKGPTSCSASTRTFRYEEVATMESLLTYAQK